MKQNGGKSSERRRIIGPPPRRHFRQIINAGDAPLPIVDVIN
jgi:hypothetical protein